MMKHSTALILALLACTICSGRITAGEKAENMIAFDLGGIVKHKYLRFSICHTISERWTISASTMVDIKGLHPVITDEELIHENEFYPVRTAEDISPWSGFALHYWTYKSYEGSYITIGFKCIEDTDADCRVGLGYQMTIAKGLSASIALEADMIASYFKKRLSGNGLTIELCYSF